MKKSLMRKNPYDFHFVWAGVLERQLSLKSIPYKIIQALGGNLIRSKPDSDGAEEEYAMITIFKKQRMIKRRLISKVFIAFLALLSFSCASSKKNIIKNEALNLNPGQVANWKSDIDFYHAQLERLHINLYHSVSKKDFESELSDLKRSLPNYNKYQVMVEMMRITRLIGDGHTIYGYWSKGYSRFPVYFRLFGDELRVVKTTFEYRYLLGKKLRAIDGTQTNELINSISPVVQGVDNQHSLEHFLPKTINVAEVLYGLKITKKLNIANFEFTDDKGSHLSATLNSIPRDQLKGLTTEVLHERRVNLGEPLQSTKGIWLSADIPTNTAYIRFDSYPGFFKMLLFSSRVKKQLLKHSIKYLIIDFRGNGGGNFFKGLVLAQMLVTVDSLDWEQGIYALIGKGTFSAGVSNAAQFKQILNAKLVGEATGGNPYGYQDADRFLLPNSKWTVQYSKRLFRMQDNQTDGLVPDIKIQIDWSDYKLNRDEQLEWILKDISSKPACKK
jgi:hypothetical protein